MRKERRTVETNQNQLKEGGLIQGSAKIFIPRDDIVCAALILLGITGRGRELVMVLAILFHLFHDLIADILKRDSGTLRISQI